VRRRFSSLGHPAAAGRAGGLGSTRRELLRLVADGAPFVTEDETDLFASGGVVDNDVGTGGGLGEDEHVDPLLGVARLAKRFAQALSAVRGQRQRPRRRCGQDVGCRGTRGRVGWWVGAPGVDADSYAGEDPANDRPDLSNASAVREMLIRHEPQEFLGGVVDRDRPCVCDRRSRVQGRGLTGCSGAPLAHRREP
jgi:hypothetical protein